MFFLRHFSPCRDNQRDVCTHTPLVEIGVSSCLLLLFAIYMLYYAN